jgi:hypothetical protein
MVGRIVHGVASKVIKEMRAAGEQAGDFLQQLY